MTMKGVSVSLRQHQQKKQRQKEEYDLKIPNISIQNIRWWELMEGDSFMAGNLVINGGKLKVFLDRSLPPPKSKMGNFPNQLLARLPMKVLLEKTQLKNFDLTYQEYNPRSKMKGTVYFKNVWMTSTAITNIKEEM